MNINNDPSSRQPSMSGQLNASPGNSVNYEKYLQVCRDFIWGLCHKGAHCKFRHQLDFEAMKNTLKFCHDFQNASGCAREHCHYLHTTKEEENLFFATGTLPRILAERHSVKTVSMAETIPQIALFIQESLNGRPQPPPPSNLAATTQPLLAPRPNMSIQQLKQPPPPPPSNLAATSQPLLAPRSNMSLQQLKQPPPPPPSNLAATSLPLLAPRLNMSLQQFQQPPPPPPPASATPTGTPQIASLFTVPPPLPTPTFSITQPPPTLPVFDASRPPPTIPVMPNYVSSEIDQHNAVSVVVEDVVRQKCNCQCVSTSYELRTSWRAVPKYHTVGSAVREKYQTTRVVVSHPPDSHAQQTHLVIRRTRQNAVLGRQPRTSDLMILEQSPTYCEPDALAGSIVTHGRHCTRASRRTSDIY